MVMRNRHDNTHSSGWWDDLPPKVRTRFGAIPFECAETEPAGPPPAVPPALHWVRELARVGLMFLAVAVVNVLFLLLALSFLTGGPAIPFADPGP